MSTLYAISPTKVGTWLDCPRRFFLQYVERMRTTGSWAHLSMGNAIHFALRDWWEVPTDDRTRDHLIGLMAEHWQTAGFRDAEQSAQWQAAAAAMTWHYLQQLDPDFIPHSRERNLGARTAGQVINGRIDRLDAVGDAAESLIVVDYKTGRRVPSEDDVRGSMALAMYALCVQQSLRRPVTRVELHHVPSGARIGRDLDASALARQIGRMEQIATEMAGAEAALRADGDTDAHFPPNPGPLCGWCDFRAHCSGASAAPAQPSWAGLPDAGDAAPAD